MFHTVLASASRRTAFTSSTRAFHYSPVANKSVVDKVKEVADNVNKTVGKSLAGAIEKGEQATDAAKSAAAGAKESAKGTADYVDKKTGQGLAEGIEKGEKVTEKTRQTIGSASKETGETVEGAKQAAQETKEDLKRR